LPRWLLLLALLAVVGCEGLAPARPPILVLVTLDTLRYDRACAPGAQPHCSMPHLAELAAEGVAFERAVAHVPLTVPSHASMFTGLAPQHHGVRDNLGYTLPAEVPTVAERLRRAGYRTAAFIGGAPLARNAGHGLERGFEHYDDRMTRIARRTDETPVERRAEEVVAAAIDWIAGHPTEAPLFVWVHLFDPHDPYDPPPGWKKAAATPYDAEVRYTDAMLGRLVQALRASPRAERVRFVVAGDHGEMLGERGELTHGIFLYEPAVRVPLVLAPASRPGTRVAAPVALADIAPTLLAWAGQSADRFGGDGRSLLPWAEDPAPDSGRVIYLETIHPRTRYGWSPLRGVLRWPHKYVASPQPELYDLAADPAERENLAGAEAQADLERALAAAAAEQVWATGAAADPEALEALASLGYVGTASSGGADLFADDVRRPAPRERIAVLPVLQEGLDALAAGALDRARTLFERGLDLDPDNALLLHNRGIVALMGGDPAAAEDWLRRAVAIEPYSDNLFSDLGLALARQQRGDEAAEAYRRALALNPSFHPARVNLAVTLHRAGQSDAALEELERVRTANPGFPGLDELAAQIRAAAGDR
jgi:arylsulfatase A-like enzyme